MSTEAGKRLARKILFFSHDGKLGDAIVNTAFVAGLKRHDPDCEIHATVAGVTAAFWAHDPRLACLWSLGGSWGDVIRTGLALRREKLDCIVTWQRMRSEKNRVLLWLARPRQLIDLHEFNRSGVAHKLESCAEALKQAGVSVSPSEMSYNVRLAARCDWVDHALPAGREVILVNLFAADAERNVGHADAVAIVRGLHAAAPSAEICLVCCGPSAAAAFAVVQECRIGQVMNCEGDLGCLFRLCERADVVISPDTAVIHVASAYDTPVVGIYQDNGIKPVQWAPVSGAHAIVLSQSALSIEGFSVEEVVAQAIALRRRGLSPKGTVPSSLAELAESAN